MLYVTGVVIWSLFCHRLPEKLLLAEAERVGRISASELLEQLAQRIFTAIGATKPKNWSKVPFSSAQQ